MVGAIATFGACSPDDGPRDNGFSSNGENTNQDNDGTADAGDNGDTNDNPDANGGDPDANDGNGDNGENGDNGDNDENGGSDDDYPREVVTDCGPIIDVGELEIDGPPQIVELELNDFDNALSASCGESAGGDVAILEFETPFFVAATVDIEVDAPADIEVRPGSCSADPGPFSLGCSSGPFTEAVLSGQTHHVFVQPHDDATEDLELEIDLEEMPDCYDEDGEPISAHTSCIDDDTALVCDYMIASADVPREYEFDCPTECGDDRCQGDHCDDPIVVSAGDSFEWTGFSRGFMNHHNSIEEVDAAIDDGQEPTCLLSDDDEDYGMGGLGTMGRDIVVEVQELSQGDQIVVDIDHADPDAVIVFVKSDCANTAQCMDVWDGVGETTVDVSIEDGETDGDITRYVVFDGLYDQTYDGLYDISVGVQ